MEYTQNELVLTIICLVLLRTFYKYVVMPWQNYRFYKKQGIVSYMILPFNIYNQIPKDEQPNPKLIELDTLSLARQERNKSPGRDLVAYVIGSQMFVSLYDVDLIKQFFVDKQEYFIKDPRLNIKRLLGDGLLLSEGIVWKKRRRLISNLFNYAFLVDLVPQIVQIVNKRFDQLKTDDAQRYNLIEEAQKVTSQVVMHVFFGTDLQDRTLNGQQLSIGLEQLVAELATQDNAFTYFIGGWIHKLGLTSHSRSIIRRIKEFQSIGLRLVREKIRKCKGAGYIKENKMDLIETLINSGQLVENEREKTENNLSCKDIVDEFSTFFVAGMDTTGHLIGISLYKLIEYPLIQMELKKEIESLIKSDNDLTMDNLRKLVKMNDFINECLRTHSPVSGLLPRKLQADVQLGKYTLKKGANINIAMVSNTHYDKYYEDPYTFLPTRWQQSQNQQQSYAYIPFSAGQRNCIGQHLALIETKIALVQWLRKFTYKLIPNYNVKWTHRFLYEPKEPFLVTLQMNQQ